jgi:heat shock protein HtpX
MKRIFLLIATNLAVMLVLSVVVSILGLDQWLTANGIDWYAMLVMSAVFGFGGAFISLLMSKWIAKMSTGAQVIDGSEGTTEYWLVQSVQKLAQEARIGMPEVALYQGPPNAFATGAFKDSSLVAVSTGLLEGMSREEVEAVLGHEVSHVANGDMVTLTLIQGVLNTFVFFLSRVVGFVSQILFGIAASAIVAWFSRRREFRADAGSASLLHSPRPMIAALSRLGQMQTGGLPDQVKAFGIDSRSGLANLFATHPPIEQRIAALQSAAPGAQ